MPEEKGTSGALLDSVRKVLAEVQDKARKRLADAIVLGVVLIFGWVWQTPETRLVLLGAASVILLRVVVVFAIGLWRYSRRKPAETEPIAPPESVQRLREVYSSCEPAIQFAFDLLVTITAEDKAKNRDQELAVRALRELFLENTQRAKGNLDGRFRETQTHSCSTRELADLSEHFAKVMTTRYRDLLKWTWLAGQAIMGESFAASQEYAQLYKLHDQYLQEIWRVRDRTDIGTVRTWQHMLSQKLQPPVSQ